MVAAITATEKERKEVGDDHAVEAEIEVHGDRQRDDDNLIIVITVDLNSTEKTLSRYLTTARRGKQQQQYFQ